MAGEDGLGLPEFTISSDLLLLPGQVLHVRGINL